MTKKVLRKSRAEKKRSLPHILFAAMPIVSVLSCLITGVQRNAEHYISERYIKAPTKSELNIIPTSVSDSADNQVFSPADASHLVVATPLMQPKRD